MLTKNFTLDELTKTSMGAYNVPNEAQQEKLLYLATYILQPIRNRFGKIQVNSGYRSEFVNEKIGGSKTSQHMKAEACDFYPLEADIDEVFMWCRNNLQFGQLINETKNGVRWIHISLPRMGGINQQIMVFDGKKYTFV